MEINYHPLVALAKTQQRIKPSTEIHSLLIQSLETLKKWHSQNSPRE
ncbi:hypothetical protein SynA1825c_02071 [Synechococcus sp. A18-25c]|nr:hypothetical protein SynA1825c_02071 [Synechococcus sp. A18-25c]